MIVMAIVVFFVSMSLFDKIKGVNYISVLQNFDLLNLSLKMSWLKYE